MLRRAGTPIDVIFHVKGVVLDRMYQAHMDRKHPSGTGYFCPMCKVVRDVEARRKPAYIRPPILRPLKLRFKILTRDGFRCRYCGRAPNEAELQIDHVIPKAKGGTNDEANLVTSCRFCNQGKGDVLLEAYGHPALDAVAVG